MHKIRITDVVVVRTEVEVEDLKEAYDEIVRLRECDDEEIWNHVRESVEEEEPLVIVRQATLFPDGPTEKITSFTRAGDLPQDEPVTFKTIPLSEIPPDALEVTVSAAAKPLQQPGEVIIGRPPVEGAKIGHHPRHEPERYPYEDRSVPYAPTDLTHDSPYAG